MGLKQDFIFDLLLGQLGLFFVLLLFFFVPFLRRLILSAVNKFGTHIY